MRWVIFGAGAVGGVVGARLHAAGEDVVLIARGAHLDAIRRDGLRLLTPEGERRHRISAVDGVRQLAAQPGDVIVLAMKGMDTGGALRDLAGHVDPATPIVCLQNGVANERAALRQFPNVYGICVMLPSTHLTPGVVVAHSAPIPGILDIGRYPGGLDETATAISAGLRRAGFESEPRADIMRWKYSKLLMNLGNAVEAVCGRADGLDEAIDPVRQEGETVLRAAGLDHVSVEQESERRLGRLTIKPVAGAPRGGGSTWQSLTRGTGSIEVDYLNGEIVLLGRLHGVPTPANELARQLANRCSREGTAPGALTPAEFMAALDAHRYVVVPPE